MTQSIGFFGGAFDPFHNGHLAIVDAGLEALKLDQLIIMPTYCPAHKHTAQINYEQRLLLLKKVFENNSKVHVSSLESKLPLPSYSLQTLEALKHKIPNISQFYFFIGTDSLNSLSSWHQWEKLADICQFVVFQRHSIQAKPPKLKRLPIYIQTDIPEISSTMVRKLILNDQPIHSYVPQTIEQMTKRFMLGE